MKRKPITIIKYGPPASGKSSEFVKKKIKEILNTEQNIPTQTNMTTFKKSYKPKNEQPRILVNINMNTPIEKNSEYVKSTKEMQETIKSKLNVKNNSTHYLNYLTEKDTSAMLNLYKYYAKSVYNLANKEFKEANKKGVDVDVIIETTGQHGRPTWLKIRQYREYHIIFPIISFETLWKRYKNRANKGPVFRILSTKEQLREVYINSYTEFLKNYLNNSGFNVHVLNNEGNEGTFLEKNEANEKITALIQNARSQNNTKK